MNYQKVHDLLVQIRIKHEILLVALQDTNKILRELKQLEQEKSE